MSLQKLQKLRFIVPVRPKFSLCYRTPFDSRIEVQHFIELLFFVQFFYFFYQLSDLHIKLRPEGNVGIATARTAAAAISSVTRAVVVITTSVDTRIVAVA